MVFIRLRVSVSSCRITLLRIQIIIMSEEEGFQKPAPAKLAKFIKIANIIVGLLIITLGVFSFFEIFKYLTGLQIFLAVSPICMVLLGLMQLGVEFRIKWVTNNFKFMDSLMGKGLFMIFLSSVLFCILKVAGYGETANFAVCLVPLLTGVLYSVLHCVSCGKGYNQDLREQLV